jgi:hypothetical protein
MKSIFKSNRMFLKILVCMVAVIFCLQLIFVVGNVSAKEKDYELTLNFTNLADPGNEHYEGWLIIDGSPVSTGKFTVDASGNILDLEGNSMDKFSLKGLDLDMATDFVLSLEPQGDTDSIPASIKPLAGTLNTEKDSASLTYNIGVDLSTVAGEYILATPTDDAAADDYYLDLEFINLANLSSGHYEGWLIVSGSPISTGKFGISDTGDILDHSSGQIMTDPFFIADLDIANLEKFVLSIEPEGDTDSVPGTVKPMAGDVNSTGVAGSIFHNIAADFSGIAGEYILATPTNNVISTDYDLGLEFTNLMQLTSGHYEGWLIVGGSPVSTGKFNISGSEAIVDHITGTPITDPFLVAGLDIDNVTDFVLSVEPDGDIDSVPGAIKPMAGAYDSGTMTGSLSHNIGVDLSSISGEYILATPTDDPAGNELSGVWFLNTTGPAAGLTLPDLTGTDWIYEGWGVISGTPVTTGRFNMSNEADDFEGYSESVNPGPPFPGEDFLLNAPGGLTFPTDLSSQTMVISIEPRVDPDPLPFQFKPLKGDVPASASDHIEYMMDDMTSMLPTGTFNLTWRPTPPSDENSGVWFLNTTGPVAGLSLPDLTGTDWTYEGWAVIGGTPVTSGRFNMNDGEDDFDGYSATTNPAPPFPGEDFLINAPAGLTFPVDLSEATIVISVEPAVDDDPGPFQFKPLVGTVPSSAMDHKEYMLEDNTDTLPTGTFELTKAPSNENSGIWFLDRSSGTPVAGLDLPDLTGTDWTYEGWVVIGGTPVTTGTFDKVNVADGFNGYSASGGSPPFPGEDFIKDAPTGLTFPTDIAGDTAVISIEPRVDNDAAPFQFKPLIGAIPSDATDHIEYTMSDNTNTMATGTVSISEMEEAEPEEDSTGLYIILVVVIIIVVVVLILFMKMKGTKPIE